MAALVFCGPESARYEHLSAVLLKPLWNVIKPQDSLSFGLDYLLCGNAYVFFRLEKLLKASIHSRVGWHACGVPALGQELL